MRVIAGMARGLKLKTTEGLDTRPTTDRIKETLFNMIQYQLVDCVFVDLFSGSGAIGIEAMSRGASKCFFFETNPKACKCIEDNLNTTKLKNSAILKKQTAVAAVDTFLEEIDIVFMDPPYNTEIEKEVLLSFQNSSYITENTLIIVEASLYTDFSYCDTIGYEIIKEKMYKTNKHVFIKKKIEEGC